MESIHKKPKLSDERQLSDSDVFITEFIDKTNAAIGGIIKARYTDFQVFEIDLSNHVARLTNLDLFKSDALVKPANEDIPNISLIPQEKFNEIESLTKSSHVAIDVTNVSKEDRTKIHDLIRVKYSKKYISQTVSENDQKSIIVKLNVKGNRSDARSRWPYDQEYVHFIVYKESIDTIQVTLKLAKSLRLNPSIFCYAGVKDKRAVTTQWFSCKKVDPIHLQQTVNQNFKNKILIGNVCLKDSNLELGQLRGNKFRIALRNVTASNNVIDRSVQSLINNGFINYYGLQRFGKFKNAPSHLIGLKLLTGQWKEACEFILLNKLADLNINVTNFDPKVAYEKLPNYDKKSIEGILLKRLSEINKNDYATALEHIPRNLRLLYLHAYQSYVWNQVVSKRLANYGLKIIIGDLVKVAETNEIETITENTLGKYTIFDLVLPQPGFEIIYPDNETKKWYQEILQKDGLTLEINQQKLKKYNLGGSYRKVIETIENLHYKIINYNDPLSDLIRTNYDELYGKDDIQNIPDGKYKALILEFDLTTSSYATMVLRELLKYDTSICAQTKLNDYN